MMKRFIVLGVLWIGVLLVLAAPAEKAEARAIVDAYCWTGTVPLGSSPVNPNIGCTAIWGPGGDASVLSWRVTWVCLTTGCTFIPTANPTQDINLLNPGLGQQSRFIGANCVPNAFVVVNMVGTAWYVKRGDLIEVRDFEDANGTTVGYYCPGAGPVNIVMPS